MANKQILARYVHDIMNMEIKRHTLDKLRLLSIHKRDRIHYDTVINAKYNLSCYDNELNELVRKKQQLDSEYNSFLQANQNKRKALETQINAKQQPQMPPISIGAILIRLITCYPIWILAVIVVATVSILGYGASTEDVHTYFIVGFYPLVIYVPLAILIGLAFGKKERDEEYNLAIAKHNNYISNIKNELNIIDNNLDTEKSKYNKAKCDIEEQINEKKNAKAQFKKQSDQIITEANTQSKFFAQQIPILTELCKTLEKQIADMHKLNLIPPNYRSFECLIAFDQMFKNDLVDNMRQAALLYDERVFRGEMVKGLDNIYNSINNLGALMANTVAVLRRIQSNTDRMCDEMMDISSNLVRMNANVTGHLSTISGNISSLGSSIDYIADNQRDIASELEYNRYANEAIRANSNRMIWYTEQRRQGLL